MTIGLTLTANRRFAVGLAHAFGGAILFSIPMIMTMEMWWLGFYGDPLRIALFILLGIPLFIALAYYRGFEATSQLKEDVLDGFSAYTVGFVAAAVMLSLFGIIGPGMSAAEIIGKIAIQAVPAGIGAELARSQFGESQSEVKRRSERYGGGLFLMAVGSLYLSISLAATEEMVLISYKMTPWHIIALLICSLMAMHGFVYAVVARGRSPLPPHTIPFWTVFVHLTVVGYAVALLVSFYMLWVFGRADGLAVGQVIEATIVLGFPAALGAGAARLIL